MKKRPEALNGADHFLDILDRDMVLSGLPGNMVQLHLYLEGAPERCRIKDRMRTWAASDPAFRTTLTRRFGQTRRRECPPLPVQPPTWHTVQDPRNVLDGRLLKQAPPAGNCPVLDIICCPDSTVVSLTWHHLLADARGGEFMLARLAGNPAGDGSPWLSRPAESVMDRIQAARRLRPVFNRIACREIAVPDSGLRQGTMHSAYLTVDAEQSAEIMARGRKVHPLIGETALLLAGALRVTHELCGPAATPGSNYLVPMPVSRRTPGCATPTMGNPVSFVYILAEAARMEDSTPRALAEHIAEQFLEAVRNGYIEACETQLGVFGYLPRSTGRHILRLLTRGRPASCFFAHTGRTVFDTGPDSDFFGARISRVFHRPMLCDPPGLGFFVCRHGGRVHITACRTGDVANDLPARLLTHVFAS